MRGSKSFAAGAVLLSTMFGAGWALEACAGDAGPKGEQGPVGATGVAGPEGSPGVPGAAADGGGNVLSGPCTTPCHTFNGVVDQWRFSNHSHPQENEVGGGACRAPAMAAGEPVGASAASSSGYDAVGPLGMRAAQRSP